MGYQFNPFTGNLDLVGAGGGGNPFDQSLNTGDTVNFAVLGVNNASPTRTYHQLGGKFLVESNSGAFGQFQFVNPTSGGEVAFLLANNAVANGDGSVSGNVDDTYVWALGLGGWGGAGNEFRLGTAAGGPRLSVTSSGNATFAGTVNCTGLSINGSAISFSSYATLTSTQTLSNKTLVSPTISSGSTSAILTSDASNILAQRAATSAQGFRVYNTFTDASNFERGTFDWTSVPNTLTIGTIKGGTGASRDVRIRSTNNVDIFALETTQAASFRSGVTILYTPLQFVPTTKAGAATTADLSSGRAGLFKNSTDGSVRLWMNDGGVMKSVALT